MAPETADRREARALRHNRGVQGGLVRRAGHCLVLGLLLLAPAAASLAQESGVVLGGTLPTPLPLFPSDNWWNVDISSAPVDPASTAFINFIQAGGRRRLHPDMGGWSGEAPPNAVTYGMPYLVVPGTQPLVPVVFEYDDESDVGAPGRPAGYPIPEEAKTQQRWIEGGLPGGGDNGDRHMLIVDRDHRILYELYALRWDATQSRWEAGSGAIFPLDQNLRRPDGWTSADAAGLAILPGLIRYDEAFGSDPIRHAFRVTVRATNGYVYPASHRAGSNPSALPMGARLRLKASKDISGYPAHLQKIFQAMKTYGLIVADNGSDMYITGTHDLRWDMDPIVPAFRSLYADDFEVVQLGWQPSEPPATDTDGDGLTDAWETGFGLDPNSAAGANGAAGDPDGDGRTNEQERDAGTHPRGFVTRYLPEGATGAFFRMRVALLNPGNDAARVLLRFQPTDGEQLTHALTVDAHSRATVDPATVPRLASAEFSTVIESDVLVVADRTMSWDSRGYGSHGETALTQSAATWYLAEGATHSGFDLFYLLQNPNSTPVTVDVTYLLPAPAAPLVRSYAVPANSRYTVWVDAEGGGLDNANVSAVLHSRDESPILVERAMYLATPGRTFGAGHASAAVPATATQWFFAEGATGSYFDLYLLIANPGTTAAQVRVDYLLPSGIPISRTYAVDARSRYTIFVEAEHATLADTAVSMLVTSLNGEGIIAERAMWWPGGGGTWQEAHNSPGATATGTRWALADGEVGGSGATETYILVANTSAFDGLVAVRLLFEDGTTVEREFPVGAANRFNVAVAAEFPGAAGRRFGAVIESRGTTPAAIVVERAMYSSAEGIGWAAGTNTLASRLP